MKRIAYKSMFLLALCAMLLMTGCIFVKKPAETDDGSEQILAELNAMKEQLNAANAELEALKKEESNNNTVTTPVDTAKPEPIITEVEIPVEMIVAENCTINGKQTVQVDGETEIHAVADEIEGYVFDHWFYDGAEDYESGPVADFAFSYPVAICAVFRERRVITCKDCHITLLDKKGHSVGKNYTEFDFEEDYVNPETKEKCKGGSISFYIFADVPKGKEVDHWIINGVKYEPPYNNVAKFRVEGQTEPTVYEVVFRKASK